jgi:hypothetical protein
MFIVPRMKPSGIHAKAAQQHAQRRREEAAGDVLGPERADQQHAPDRHRKHLHGTNLQHDVGERLNDDEKQDVAEDAAQG